MDDFVRKAADMSVSELDNEIQRYEEMCLRYLEAYKECRSDECRFQMQYQIQQYENCISILRDIQSLKLSNQH
jgi:hypothetical protein